MELSFRVEDLEIIFLVEHLEIIVRVKGLEIVFLVKDLGPLVGLGHKVRCTLGIPAGGVVRRFGSGLETRHASVPRKAGCPEIVG